MNGLRSSLDSLFRPQSVAVSGASVTPGSVGNILMRNLLENPFGGVVFPINPKRRAVQGVLCYPNLAAVPEKVELAVIATPAATVPNLVRECVERGVAAAIIISAGFAELGAEGRKLEDEVRGIARGNMRIVGPNCLEIIHPPSNLNASFAASMAAPGSVALLSQSGAICTAILDWARQAHVGFSSFVSVGSMRDVDFADLIDHFADDPTTVRLPNKPVPACWMGGVAVREGIELLNTAGIPTFDAPESAIRAFLHMVQYRRNQELLYETPPALPENSEPNTPRVRRLFEQVRAAGRTLLTEVEAKEVLAAYGLPVVPAVGCRTAEEAVAAAKKIGYPVVLKLLSSILTHKSDVGGVQLNLTDEKAVRAAFAAIESNVNRLGKPGAFEGVSVQAMVRERGYELIIGSSLDRQFGPVILFGCGGILVEVFKDRALALPPLNRTLARRLMERTKIYEALQGVRGQKAVNLEALETLLARFSQLLVDFPEIQEVDLNPVLATPERVIALDARLLLSSADQTPEQCPKLAIHPYPNQYEAPFRLRDGREVTIRPIRPEDEPLILALHASHSEHTLRMRFFGLVKTLSRDSLIRLCHLDYDREMALTAVLTEGDEPRLLGVARYYLHAETGVAEFAVVVTDAYQRQGLGRHLMQRLIDIARECGVRRLVGQVLIENRPMLHLMHSLDFSPPIPVEDQVVRVELSLTETMCGEAQV